MPTSNIERMVKSTVDQMHSVRDQIREHIYLGATELKEIWLDLEMRSRDVEKQDLSADPKTLDSLQDMNQKWTALRGKLCTQ